MKNNKGFTIIEGLLILVILGLIGGTGWYLHHSKNNANNSYNNSANTSSVTKDSYAGWKTYTNDKYGVTFKYPSAWVVNEGSVEPNGADPQEFATSLAISPTTKYGETAEFAVHTTNLATTTKWFDELLGQAQSANLKKTTGTLKGKPSVIYKSDYADSKNNYEEYLFGVGDKTYSFGSTNETLNVDRSASYWSDFHKVFDSLTIK